LEPIVSGRKAHERHGVPAALPTVQVRTEWITSLSPASLSMWIASLTALQMLLLQQLQSIALQDKIVALGIVSVAGALSRVLATPLAGACQVA
jgi:hypothetical protein